MTEYTDTGATISSCGRYRYRLWREWSGQITALNWRDLDAPGGPYGDPRPCVFVMLNPSTADGALDDPTIRRCVSFAKAAGYNRLEVVNLFAYRATSPAEMLDVDHNGDPVGPDNLEAVNRACVDAGLVICAWGAHGGHLGQDETMLGWLDDAADGVPIWCLGKTAAGYPRHPLYIKGDTALIAFP